MEGGTSNTIHNETLRCQLKTQVVFNNSVFLHKHETSNAIKLPNRIVSIMFIPPALIQNVPG
jgi:hypothetical protein